eukprot:3768808-Rhodomonas_salina.3
MAISNPPNVLQTQRQVKSRSRCWRSWRNITERATRTSTAERMRCRSRPLTCTRRRETRYEHLWSTYSCAHDIRSNMRCSTSARACEQSTSPR